MVSNTINIMVYESLLDKKIETVSNQGKQLEQLMPMHNSNLDRMMQMRQLQQQNQSNFINRMHQQQSDNSSKLELKQDTGKQAIPQTQEMVNTLQSQLNSLQQSASMIPNGYISMPYKLSPKMKKITNKIDAVRDTLLNIDQGLV